MEDKIKNELLPNETIIKQVQFSRFVVKWLIVIAVPVNLLCLIINPVVFAIALLLTLIVVIPVSVHIKSLSLVVTDKRVIGKVGVISTKTMDSPLDKIQNVSVEKTKGLKFGTVTITTASGVYKYTYVKDAEQFKNAVMQQVGISQNGIYQIVNQQNESVADEITKFKKLLDDGAITVDEFENKKRELLSK